VNIGLFYQSGYRIEACYHALAQFRTHYPSAPVALYEDNTNILLPVARKFGCVYQKTDKQGFNDPESGRPAFDLETTLAWLARVNDACETTLAGVDWVVHFEDDVWFKNPLIGPPPFDLSGIGGRAWHPKLYEYLRAAIPGVYGCGGSVFNRKKFLTAYNRSKQIDWDLLDRLATDDFRNEIDYPRPTRWTDSALTVVFMFSGFSVGNWGEIDQYFNQDVRGGCGRLTWPGTMAKLEAAQKPGVNVIHCWKPYYYPTAAEKQFVTDALAPFV
jgi:hypothetical protein